MATGIFGGTFDPVHIGHLRTALELKQHLHLASMRLIPSGDPPHRDTPRTAAADRLAMVELAVAGEPGLVADGREVARPGPSYTIDTLRELRAEVGHTEPLCLCLGMDSLVNITTWVRWREFLDYAHIVVAARPGWTLPAGGQLPAWLAQHRTAEPEALLNRAGGLVYLAEMTLLPVAATDLRAALARGESIRYLTTDGVLTYIGAHHLYEQSL